MPAPRHLFAFVVLASTLLAAAEEPTGAPHRQARRIMGTACEVQVFHDDPEAAEAAVDAALDEMARVDRLLSNYDPASELSAMNREATRAPFRASPELFAFLQQCARYHEITERAFDPTVGPLVRAWGFFSKAPARPAEAAVSAARANSGFDKVSLDPATRSVRFDAASFEVDPGGIGKGYAVDRAVETLRQRGIRAALVSAGGSTLYALGHPPGRDGWRVAIRNPADPARPLGHVTLRDLSLSTSGAAEKSVIVDGRRYSHIFDPRSGEPVAGMCQVTLIAPTATDSDALSTAAFILPRERAAGVLRGQPGAHALRVEGDCGPQQQVWITPWSADVFQLAR